ncbi:MAG: serine/threonine-protein phosphatase [Sphingomonadales bacterium]|nr:serine/threonine-protein phosphatase [Sphingomonadales bacterium]
MRSKSCPTSRSASTNQRGCLIGIAEEAAYEEQIIPLQQGDRLFLYSDGLLEEPDSSGELFGKERLLDMLTTHRSIPLNDSVQLLEQAVLTWSGKACLQDDLAILAVDIQSLSPTGRP